MSWLNGLFASLLYLSELRAWALFRPNVFFNLNICWLLKKKGYIHLKYLFVFHSVFYIIQKVFCFILLV